MRGGAEVGAARPGRQSFQRLSLDGRHHVVARRQRYGLDGLDGLRRRCADESRRRTEGDGRVHEPDRANSDNRDESAADRLDHESRRWFYVRCARDHYRDGRSERHRWRGHEG